MKTILVEGVPVRIPTHEEIAWLDTLPTAEFLAEMKRIWVIMAIDTLQFPDLPLKDVLYLARRIAEWIRQ
jgi:hypothetical protein